MQSRIKVQLKGAHDLVLALGCLFSAFSIAWIISCKRRAKLGSCFIPFVFHFSSLPTNKIAILSESTSVVSVTVIMFLLLLLWLLRLMGSNS